LRVLASRLHARMHGARSFVRTHARNEVMCTHGARNFARMHARNEIMRTHGALLTGSHRKPQKTTCTLRPQLV
jgi:hypothetical protein